LNFFGYEVREWAHKLLFGSGVGAAAMLVLELAHAEPKLFIETFRQWGAAAFLTLVALFLVNSWLRAATKSGTETAAAMQRLADSVQMIAQKDTEEQYEQKILLGHIGSSIEKLRESMADLSDRLEPNPRLARGVSR